MKLEFLKCHGSGNDFILIDEATGVNAGVPERRRSRLAAALCDRDNGVGADGALFYLASERADCQMRMFNPDGGEAEMCGNGLRCVGRYCSELARRDLVLVETPKAVLAVWRSEDIFAGIKTFEAEIGPVSLAVASLPMVAEEDPFIARSIAGLPGDLKFTAVSAPNPHIVAVVDEIDENLLRQCGAMANQSTIFPRGVNVSFAMPLHDNAILLITYERGAGVTDACGTAMSASAYALSIIGVVSASAPVRVFNKGGMVSCDVANVADGIVLRGNATFVYQASVELSRDLERVERCRRRREYSDEVDAYRRFHDYARSAAAK